MRTFFLAIIICLFALSLEAQNGDTVVVQTFSFGSPQNAWFQFPADTISWEKILMKYTLKCHPSPGVGSPPFPCGEWDYQTYTYLYEHTGTLDSTLLHHPSFLLDGASPDSLSFSFVPTMAYFPVVEYSTTWLDTISLIQADFGNSTIPLNRPVGQPGEPFRLQFSIPAADLWAQGFGPGPLLGMDLRLQVNTNPSTFSNFRIRLGLNGLTTVEPSLLLSQNLNQVLWRNLFVTAGDSLHLLFDTPFLWDGTSNLLVDVSYDQTNQAVHIPLKGDGLAGSGSQLVSGYDGYLDFEGPDMVSIPHEAFATIDSAITVCLWVFGDPDFQPQSQTTLEGVDSLGNRVINVHLPWGNANVYWDAGNTGGNYDRINALAPDSAFEGRWNHWAFTKNVATGIMRIYLNGQPFSSATGRTRTMTGIRKFRLGSSASGSLSYDGLIDGFQVWNKELTQTEITEWMSRSIDPSHPAWSNLQLDFPFDPEPGLLVTDHSPAHWTGLLEGIPQKKYLTGANLFKNPEQTDFRPWTRVYGGDVTIQTDSNLVLLTEANPIQVLVLFSDSLNPLTPTDTLLVYPPQYLVGPDSTGFGLDTLGMTMDSTIYLAIWDYYGPPFEVINRYELLRYITPYGINLNLGTDGFTWTYDLTDYGPLLHDSVHLSAGNWQELLDVKFIMIKGTPSRRPIQVKNLWTGNYYLSNFESTVLPQTVALPAGSSQYRVKTRASGHGMAMPNNCAEFCPKIHSLSVNGNLVWQWYLWKLCSTNPLFPQGGTWIYNRAGWCPGTETDTYHFEITPLIAPGAQNVTIDYDSEYDTGGNYNFEAQLISYGPSNFEHDVAILDVPAPSQEKINTRLNPMCNQPQVLIQNNGTQFVHSVSFEYGIYPDSLYTFTWEGQLDYLDSATVYLPALPYSHYLDANNKSFRVQITNVDGIQDEYPYNNQYHTTIKTPPVYTAIPVITFQTNAFASENTWVLYDANQNVVFSRSGFENNTLYKDTLNFLSPGCYEFALYDSDEDGISFWNNDDGDGYLRIRKLGAGTYAILEPDFGAEIRHRFVYRPATNESEIAERNQNLSIYPNPTDSWATIEFQPLKTARTLSIRDISGRIKAQFPIFPGQAERTIDTSPLEPGFYFVELTCPGRPAVAPFLKL